MKIKVPDVPRDENVMLCWKQEVNAHGNITTFQRCTKPKHHDDPGGWDRRHSWEMLPDPNAVSQLN